MFLLINYQLCDLGILFYIDLDYDAAVDELNKEYEIGLIDRKSYIKNFKLSCIIKSFIKFYLL